MGLFAKWVFVATLVCVVHVGLGFRPAAADQSSPTPWLVRPVASDTSDYSLTSGIGVYDSVVSFPGLPWQSGATIEATTKIYKNQAGPQFIFEQIPKDQEFDSWRQMHAIFGLYDKRFSQIDPKVVLDNLVGQDLSTYEKACGRRHLSYDLVERSGTHMLVALFCENSPNARAGSGYGDGVGEISIRKYFVVKNTFVKVYHHWKGGKFDRSDAGSWPVSWPDFEAMVKDFHKVTAFPK